MTTIATDGRLMAADGRTTAGTSIINDSAIKLTRLPDGSVVGGAGDADFWPKAVEELARSLRESDEPALMKGDYVLLRLLPSGRLLQYYDKLLPYPVTAPAAIGSGGDIARGAMIAGKHPVDAIRISRQLDAMTGGRIRTMKLRP